MMSCDHDDDALLCMAVIYNVCSVFLHRFTEINALMFRPILLLLSVTLLLAPCAKAQIHLDIQRWMHDILECQQQQQQQQKPSDTVSIVMTGDIVMGLNYPRPLLPPNDGATLFADMKPFLQNATATFGNLEGVLADCGLPTKHCSDSSNCYIFRMPERYGRWLAEAGFDCMSIANNHAHDFGDSGMQSSCRVLRANDIAVAGSEMFCSTDTFTRQGVRFGFIAFAFSNGTNDLRKIDRAVRMVHQLRSQCDVLVISMHGGAEGRNHSHTPRVTEYFLGENRGCVYCFAHAMIDAGADVVYGHGPHVVRGVELYKGKFIAYSLGNFCTPYRVNLAGISGYAPAVYIRIIRRSGAFVDGKILSAVQLGHDGPRCDAAQVVVSEFSRLSKIDFPESPLTIDSDGSIKR